MVQDTCDGGGQGKHDLDLYFEDGLERQELVRGRGIMVGECAICGKQYRAHLQIMNINPK